MCPQCKQRCPIRKSQRLIRPPANLIVHLKRFAPDYTKIQRPVKIDLMLDNLVLKESCEQSVNNQQLSTYHLLSSVMHDGSLEKGHYGTFYRESRNQWFGFDDEIVIGDIDDLRAAQVLENFAYFCLYRSDREVENTGPLNKYS